MKSEWPPIKAVLLILSFCFLFLSFTSGQSKVDSSAIIKSSRYFDKAISSYHLGDNKTALKLVRKSLSVNPLNTDALILKGDISLELKQYETAIKSYQQALQQNPVSPEILLNLLGNVEFSLKHYKEAGDYFSRLLGIAGIRDELRTLVSKKLSLSNFRKDQIEHPVPFDPKNLGQGVNTAGDEYVNAITADEMGLYFTRRSPLNEYRNNIYKEFEEDFYFSGWNGNAWAKANKLGYPVDNGDGGALCISPDGQEIYFTACYRSDSYGSCDLYYSKKTGDKWSSPRNMGPLVNSDQWDSQPSISSDGNTLYFASKRKGGKGSSDIWKTIRQENGSWGSPVNLGDSINTTQAEMGPFIHYDNKSLYFSSQGHEGMGGADLFLSRKDTSGNWKSPVNLGYPINTSSDELVIILNPRGDMAYFSSDTLSGYGRYDIYSFVPYQGMRPEPVTYLEGKVFDKESGKPLMATILLIDLGTGKDVVKVTSNTADGKFLVCIPTDRDYALNVSATGYLFYSEHFGLRGYHEKLNPYHKDIPLEAVRVGSSIVLNNIFYETDKYDLKHESSAELNKLAAFLKNNPGLNVEIGGHTDNVNTAAYNLELSKRRAETVYNYLVKEGISPERLSYKGYGLTKPIATNDTPEGRALNRRTEIKIISVN